MNEVKIEYNYEVDRKPLYMVNDDAPFILASDHTDKPTMYCRLPYYRNSDFLPSARDDDLVNALDLRRMEIVRVDKSTLVIPKRIKIEVTNI